MKNDIAGEIAGSSCAAAGAAKSNVVMITEWKMRMSTLRTEPQSTDDTSSFTLAVENVIHE
jgi:hypothetical protein